MIILDRLAIGYSSRHGTSIVAEDMCASAADGSLVCLVGANGTGKSTLIRTVAGFQKPLGGDVLVGMAGNIQPTGQMKRSEKSRMIGVVLTERPVLEHLTVRDVVGLGRTPYTGLFGNLSDADRAAVDRALQLAGIAHIAERDMACLSDGERQKVMIAKALAQQPSVLVLDEPSAFLDYPSKKELMSLLARLAHEENKTILVSSHDLHIISGAADLFWVMERDEGRTLIRVERELHPD